MTCLSEITTRPSISSRLRRLDSKINVTPPVTQELTWGTVDLYMCGRAGTLLVRTLSVCIMSHLWWQQESQVPTISSKMRCIVISVGACKKRVIKQLCHQNYDVKEWKAIVFKRGKSIDLFTPGWEASTHPASLCCCYYACTHTRQKTTTLSF